MNTATNSPHKYLYKATFDNKWKEQFKQKCLQKAKLQKEDQLKRFRVSSHQKPELQVDLPNIIKTEWCVNQDFQKSDNLSNEDYEDIMHFLEKELEEYLINEEQQILKEFEEFEEHSLQNSIEGFYGSSKQGANDVFVLCPICKKNPVFLNKGVFFCNCGIRIDSKGDANLLFLQKQIMESSFSHNANCSQDPHFEVTSKFGIPTLVLNCPFCQDFQVIL